ncbi:PhyH-domain-containing protein [Setomelanomma holmii]|uniref:PhyH-domain-containing protein n=1 Tax=Setomelanomma holmii TaxID=210430 RepID=A0A9P4GX38_9PLEO|nr:PhyH-domain-containing protein [Setomelanomma holmii]
MLGRVPLSLPEMAIEVIEKDGGVILTDFASLDQLYRVYQDVRKVWKQRYRGRMHAGLLFGRSATAREQWCLNPYLLAIVNQFLRTTNAEDVDRVSASQRSTDAMLSQAASITIVEGGDAQPLHRDDAIWQKAHTSQEQTGYRLGSDLGIGMLVAAVDTTHANGATLVVPGSHLWEDARRAQEHEIATAELSRGEALLFLTSTLHAGDANTTPDPRTMYAIFYCRSWIRPEASDFTCYNQEEVESWSTKAQMLAGYVTDKMLGICDGGDALDALRRRCTQRWQDWLI